MQENDKKDKQEGETEVSFTIADDVSTTKALERIPKEFQGDFEVTE